MLQQMTNRMFLHAVHCWFFNVTILMQKSSATLSNPNEYADKGISGIKWLNNETELTLRSEACRKRVLIKLTLKKSRESAVASVKFSELDSIIKKLGHPLILTVEINEIICFSLAWNLVNKSDLWWVHAQSHAVHLLNAWNRVDNIAIPFNRIAFILIVAPDSGIRIKSDVYAYDVYRTLLW